MSSSFLFLFLFLFVSCFFGEVVGGNDPITCPPAPLTNYGEQMRAKKAILLFVFLAHTGKQPCLGQRDDWREMMPRCFQNMTNVEAYTYVNETGLCTSCSLLKPVPCLEVFDKQVGVLVAVGGAYKIPFICKDNPLVTDTSNFPPSCYFHENEYFDQQLSASFSRFSNAIRVMIPIAWLGTKNWGVLEGANVYGIAEEKARQWVILEDNYIPKFVHEEKRKVREEDLERVKEAVMKAGGKWGGNMFLYISRVDGGKGQASFIYQVTRNKDWFRANDISFKFILSLDQHNKHTQRLKRSLKEVKSFNESDLFTPLDHKFTKPELDAFMMAARGLVHFAEMDRNPRIIAESLVARLPVLATAQSAAFSTLECAPPSVAVISDVSNVTNHSLIPLFKEFLEGTKDQKKVEKDISAVVEGLAVANAYPCMCEAFGICDTLAAPDSYGAFREVFEKEGAMVPERCALGMGLEGVTCDKSEMAVCARWGSWFNIRDRRGEGKMGLFSSKLNQETHKFLINFDKRSCYIPEERDLFMELVGHHSMKKAERSLEKIREGLRNPDFPGPPSFTPPSLKKEVSPFTTYLPAFLLKLKGEEDEDGEKRRKRYHRKMALREEGEERMGSLGKLKKRIGSFFGKEEEEHKKWRL